jgi:hypothetical protein
MATSATAWLTRLLDSKTLAVAEVAMNADAIQSSTQNNLDLAQRSLEQMETVAATMRSTNAHQLLLLVLNETGQYFVLFVGGLLGSIGGHIHQHLGVLFIDARYLVTL